jgi:hypothetical protein
MVKVRTPALSQEGMPRPGKGGGTTEVKAHRPSRIPSDSTVEPSPRGKSRPAASQLAHAASGVSGIATREAGGPLPPQTPQSGASERYVTSRGFPREAPGGPARSLARSPRPPTGRLGIGCRGDREAGAGTAPPRGADPKLRSA